MLRALLLVVALVLSGCAGKEAAAPEEAHVVEVEPGLWLAEGAGAVRATVVSDAGLAVSGARISIIGSDHFGQTDKQGRILFANVSAGLRDVQVSAQNFQVHKQQVDVRSLAVSELNVTLLPEADVGGGYRPHVHDLWRGSDTYVVIDHALDLGQKPKGAGYPDAYYQLTNGVFRPLTNATQWFVPLTDQPDDGPPIVLPGTKTLTFTASWDAATLDALGVCIWPPEDAVCLPPQSSPATWTLDVRADQADSGHARWSQWRFYLFHDPLARSLTPSAAVGEVGVRLELERGNVPVDPPHPEFWSQADQRVVYDDTLEIPTACCSGHPSFRPEQIVPPGTSRLRIEHTWEFRGAGAGPLDFDYQMLVMTGASNPHTSAYSDYLEPQPVEGSAAEFGKVYELDLSAEDADAYYQARSSWDFVIWNPLFEKENFHAQHRGVVHTVRVIAYR